MVTNTCSTLVVVVGGKVRGGWVGIISPIMRYSWPNEGGASVVGAHLGWWWSSGVGISSEGTRSGEADLLASPSLGASVVAEVQGCCCCCGSKTVCSPLALALAPVGSTPSMGSSMGL